MCGIAGIISLNKSTPPSSIIRAMTSAQAHRGPDAEGFFEDGPIALGHRRLSIIDTTTGANQPFTDASNNFVTVYNGELYNYKEVKASMPDRSFATQGDTEVLIETFAKNGIDGLRSFKGMFAFGIWDKRSQQLTLARDRMGVKPMYYYKDEHWFIFASEIRAILATGLMPRKIDPQGLYEYFSYQSVSAPSTLVQGIRQLPAGHYLTLKEGVLQIQSYWSLLEQSVDFEFSNKALVQKEINHRLSASVASRMVSDVPVGAFLSGGIDSSAVVALMAATSTSPVNTFNVSFSESEFDESYYAQLVAKKFNTNHQRILLKPEAMLQELPNALASMDSPSGDGINTYVVSKAVKNAGITVALSGIGGDELFAGYPFFKQYHLLRKLSPFWNLLKPARAAGALLANRFNANPKLEKLLESDALDLKHLYPIFRGVNDLKDLNKLFTFPNKDRSTAMVAWIQQHQQSLATMPKYSQITAAELMGYTQQTLLKDTDQMGMAVSLEIREPFFDHELVAFMLQVPDALKHPQGHKKLLVDSLQGLLPDEIVHRKKQGFTFPWKHWMKNELKEFCATQIRSITQRRIVNEEHVMSLWNRFLKNEPAVRWSEIWLLVVLEHWLQQHQLEYTA